MTALEFIVPVDVDDARRPSGGNAYDVRLRDGLRAAGWAVRQHSVAGDWARPDADARGALAAECAALPADAHVLIDGLLAVAVPDAIAHAAGRARLAVLLHMPFGEALPRLADAERVVLGSAHAIITTSAWTRDWIVARYGLAVERTTVALPGVDAAPLAIGNAGASRLLCVAAVSRPKGQDVLLAALGQLADLRWDCTCVGAAVEGAGFMAELHAAATAQGTAGRVHFTGALHGAALAAAYARADVLVLPSRREGYGMVVTEALARGLPVIASAVGGVAEALGAAPDGAAPGLLVPAASPTALARALRRWLTDAAWRAQLRGAAQARRTHLAGWDTTVRCVARTLAGMGE